MNTTLRSMLISGTAAALVRPAHAGHTYKLVPVPLFAGGTSAEGWGVNNYGVAVGRFVVGSRYHGFAFNSATGVGADLGDLGSAGTDAGAYAVNDAGVVVGTYLSSEFTWHAFRWEAGVFDDITINMTNHTSQIEARARAINGAGQIAGSDEFNCNASATPPTGCRWSAGGASVVPAIVSVSYPCSTSYGYGINSAGRVVGVDMEIVNGSGWSRPILWDGATQTELPSFSGPANHAHAYGINDSGQVCGFSEDRSGAIGSSGTACWWPAPGTILQLHDLSGAPDVFSDAWAINNSTDIVGTADSVTAVIWPGGAALPLKLSTLTVPPQGAPPAGWSFSVAHAISDTGFIVGTGTPAGGGQARAFVLAPCDPVIVSGPGSFAAYVHQPASVSVAAVGAGPFTYQWRRNGAPLSNGPAPGGGTISGADAATLSIDSVGFADLGVYDVVVTGACGAVTSGGGTLAVSYCPSDFNRDEFVSGDDFDGFAVAFDAGDPSADADGNGFVNGDDFDYFSQHFDAGC